MRTAMGLLRAFLLAATATVSVQPQPQPPNLTGTWLATKDTPATMAPAPSAVFGERFGLRQEGKNLALIRPVRGRATALTVVFPLDGSETTVLSPSRPCMGQSGQVITMAWESDVLRYLIVGTVAPGASSPTRSPTPFGYRFRSISAEKLVIETTMRDAASGEVRAIGTVYQRSTEALPEIPPAPPKTPPVAPAKIAQVSWIAGDWINVTGTGSIEERWSTGAGGGMIATSRTLRGDVMTAFEFLCISERDGTLVYTAMPNAGTATDFTLTKVDADSATFENPAHDFPKMIRYAKRADGGLDATISGAAGSRPTTFSFKRK
ncbi:MAG TPA: DUF6265 family protein [Vicinamibacterales bacterium]|nr:DUF6265 family protein [Vicinamibacterales bacterium]